MNLSNASIPLCYNWELYSSENKEGLFSCCCNKIPGRSNLRKEGLILPWSLRAWSIGRGEQAGGSVSSGCAYGCSASILPFIQPRTPASGVVNLPSSIHLTQTTHCSMPRALPIKVTHWIPSLLRRKKYITHLAMYIWTRTHGSGTHRPNAKWT